MLTIRAAFDDGNTVTAAINATWAEARAYYVGQVFNLGDGAGGDLMAVCTGLEIIGPACICALEGNHGPDCLGAAPRGRAYCQPCVDRLAERGRARMAAEVAALRAAGKNARIAYLGGDAAYIEIDAREVSR